MAPYLVSVAAGRTARQSGYYRGPLPQRAVLARSAAGVRRARSIAGGGGGRVRRAGTPRATPRRGDAGEMVAAHLRGDGSVRVRHELSAKQPAAGVHAALRGRVSSLLRRVARVPHPIETGSTHVRLGVPRIGP